MFQNNPSPQGVIIQQTPQMQTQVPVVTTQQVQAPAPVVPAQQVQAPAQQMFYNEQAGGYQVQQVPLGVQQAPVQTQAPIAPAVTPMTGAEEQLTQFFNHADITSAQVEQELKAFGKLTDGTLKLLVDKHGEATANLVAQNMQAVYTQKVAANQANTNTVYALLKEQFSDMTEQTGAETYAELQTWAKQNLGNEQRQQIASMLNQGGLATELAVGQLVTLFKASNGVQQKASVLDGVNVAPNAGTGSNLTVSQYADELAKLTKTGVPYDSPQAELLKQRRNASRKRGIN